MAVFRSFRDASRVNWGRTVEDDGKIDDREDIQHGAILRIADATEAMAKNHVRLQEDLDSAQRQVVRLRASNERLQRQVNGLRGYLKRVQKENRNDR